MYFEFRTFAFSDLLFRERLRLRFPIYPCPVIRAP